MFESAPVSSQNPTHALRIIAPSRTQEQHTLTTLMHSLGLSPDHPLALELASMGNQRSVMVRTNHPATLIHVETQVRAHLPQAECVELTVQTDPLVLQEGEAVSVVELRPGAPAYLPLHTFHNETDTASRDPLLGLFAALDALPPGLRAVSQVAILPAPATWSRPYQRKALEPALEPERVSEQTRLLAQRSTGAAPSTAIILLGAIVVVLLLVVRYTHTQVPAWIIQALRSLRQGHAPVLSPVEQLQLYGGGGGIILGVLALMALIRLLLQRRFPLYDQTLVAEHTSRVAYYARLRLYVIGPAMAEGTQNTHPTNRRRGTSFSRFGYLFLWFRQLMERVLGMHLLQNTVRPIITQLHAHLVRAWQQWQRRRTAMYEREAVLLRMQAAYRQFHHPTGNYFVARRCASRQARRLTIQQVPDRSGQLTFHTHWDRHLQRHAFLMSVDVLATLWHLLPAEDLREQARIEQRQVHTRFLSPLLETMSRDLSPLGICDHAGHRAPFGLPAECLRSHMLIGGKSGTGKSTLMTYIAQVAMQQQGGLVLIDPHGDLVETLLALVPAHRVDDVLLIDLSDQEYAIGLNPLDASGGHGRDKAVSDLLTTLSHIWASSWGSRMEIAFAYALRTLYDANRRLLALDAQGGRNRQHTLLDVMALLTDESFCHALLEHIEDPFTHRWWQIYYDPLSQAEQRDRTDPVLSKVARFESQIARRIIGQSRSTIDFREAIRDQKLILVKLAKGVVGEDVARLLGATMLGLLQIALEEQATLSQQQRAWLPILIDEFQVLTGVDWAGLAELRKYGAAFVLATQSLTYVQERDPAVLPMVLANIKQYAIFQMSAQDAEIIAPELGMTVEDIVALDMYLCYLRLTVAGQRQPTFSLKLLPPVPPTASQATRIREQCRAHYSQPAAAVEDALKVALIRTLAAQSTHGRTLPTATETRPRARQEGHYRGRLSQKQKGASSSPTTPPPAPMNWRETVGSRPTPQGSTAPASSSQQGGPPDANTNNKS